MKRILIVLCVALAMVLAMTACGGSAKYKDGTYTAESEYDEDSGWKDVVTVTVSGGKITAADWNGIHKDGGEDKKTQSENGEYDMKAAGAQWDWHEQAAQMEQELINTQEPSKIKVNSEGYADSVSGVTIHVTPFVRLAEQALSQAK